MIGRPETIGAAIGVSAKAAYHWRNPRTGRAAGDLPSADVMRRLLAFARANRIPLEPRHLIEGATRAEIDALLGRNEGEIAA